MKKEILNVPNDIFLADFLNEELDKNQINSSLIFLHNSFIDKFKEGYYGYRYYKNNLDGFTFDVRKDNHGYLCICSPIPMVLGQWCRLCVVDTEQLSYYKRFLNPDNDFDYLFFLKPDEITS